MKEEKPCSMRKHADEMIERTRKNYGLPAESEGLSGLSRQVQRQLRREQQQQPARRMDMLPSKRVTHIERDTDHPRMH